MLTVRVTNLESGRVDIHKNLTKTDLEWIECNPNLRVEVIEVSMKKEKRRGSSCGCRKGYVNPDCSKHAEDL